MKTKLVLLITSHTASTTSWGERESYIRDFCANLEEQLEQVTVRYTTYQDLRFTIRAGESSIFDSRNKIDLRECAFVHFKNWRFEPEEASVTAAYLKQHHVLFYDTEVDTPWPGGKLKQMFQLSQIGLPVPDSFYAHRSHLVTLFDRQTLPEGFVFPMVMKASYAAKGDNNFLVASFAEAQTALAQIAEDKQILLQNFIANDGDYRFLFIGFDAQPLVFMRTALPGSHLNNTSKGGSGTFIDLATLPSDYVRYARLAAEALHREIGGVDIIVDKHTGEPYILEVNGTPALASGYGQEQKVKKFAAFLTHVLDEAEEE